MGLFTRTDIRKFSRTHMEYLRGFGFYSNKSGDLFRSRGHFLQCILFWISRGGYLHVSPTFFVLGANPRDSTIHQAVSLHTDDPRKWHFNDVSLDQSFAVRLIDQLEQESTLSFVSPLLDETIDSALRRCATRDRLWVSSLFLAFFSIIRGAETLRDDVHLAKKVFGKYCEPSLGKSLRDGEQVVSDRIAMLEQRVDDPDCSAISRREAEEHAIRLKLQPLSWPTEWR